MSERGGLREHYIRLGDRLIARVDQREVQPIGGGGVVTVGRDPRPTRALLLALLALCLVLLGRALTLTGARSRPRARAAAVASLALAAGLVQSGCFPFGSSDRPLWENEGTLYFHHGISPGPTLLTRDDGTVLEERRYEPFGDDIDALREPPGGGTPSTGPIDFTVDAHNILNKQSDPDTGWSYHGARWMAPEAARWLTPDPPVKAPDPKLAAEPWSAHPYQYVNQNPIAFWDPDGHDEETVRVIEDTIVTAAFAYTGALGGGGQPSAAAARLTRAGIDWAKAHPPDLKRTAKFGVIGLALAAECVPCAVLAAGALSEGKTEGQILGDIVSTQAAGGFWKGWRGGGARSGAAGGGIPPSTLVCRGGQCTADLFTNGNGVTTAADGTLSGVSTQSRVGAAIETLAQPFRNGQVGVTTVGDIEAAGGRVVLDGTIRNPNHATLSGITAKQAETLFTPTIANPVAKSLRGTFPKQTPNN